jgi:hypothetical protein
MDMENSQEQTLWTTRTDRKLWTFGANQPLLWMESPKKISPAARIYGLWTP